jgi:hypothetical protein
MTTTIEPEFSIFGWPLFLTLTTLFIANFFIARYITGILIQKKYIKKNSIEFKKTLIAWFFPIVGGLGLLMLLETHNFIRFWRRFGKWLMFN